MKEDENNTSLLHNFQGSGKKSSLQSKILLIFIGCALVGIGLGFVLSRNSKLSVVKGGVGGAGSSSAGSGSVIGSNDTSTFKDTAEGTVATGGVNGEGQFHLVRPGGESQNVYMTSSIVDLSALVGKKIKVWGQTQKAQSAGWLMDVGRVEVE